MPLLKTIIHHLKENNYISTIVPSYYLRFDRKYMGFKKKTITFIAARPCNGKTYLLCNLAVNMAKHNTKVLFFTQNIIEIAKKIANIVIDLPAIDIEDMQVFNSAEFRDKCKKLAPDIVFIDVHLLGNIVNKKILRRIKQIAQEQNFAVIITGTLNRSIDIRPDKYPQRKDLFGINEQTGVLETADMILMLHNPQHYIPDFMLSMPKTVEIFPVRAYSSDRIRLEWQDCGRLSDYHPKPEIIS